MIRYTRVPRPSVFAGLILSMLIPVTASAQARPEVETIFGSAHRIWQAGTVRLTKPFEYRDGKLLVFPGKIDDQIPKPLAKPASIMFIYEMGEESAPLYEAGVPFFAPIELLPRNAYWRDNLPLSPRHKPLGGDRYVFRQKEEIEEARKRISAFLVADQVRGLTAHRARIEATIDCLASTLPILRRDAARYLADNGALAYHFPDDRTEAFGDFLEGDAPVEERVWLIGAVGRRGLKQFKPVLERLAKGTGDDAEAARSSLALLAEASAVPASATNSPSNTEASKDPVPGAMLTD